MLNLREAAAAAAASGGADLPSSATVLESFLQQLRNAHATPEAALSAPQLAQSIRLLFTTTSAGSALLERRHRRVVIRALKEHVGPEGLAQALIPALPDLELGPNATLAGLLADMGPEGLPTIEVVRAALARFGMTEATPPDEAAVAELLGALLSVSSEEIDGGATTDYAAIVRTLSTFPRYLTWQRVVRLLDEPEALQIAHGPANGNWSALAAALLAAPHDGVVSALSGLFGTWQHRLRQLHILSGLLSVETFSFVSLPGRRVVTAEDVATASQTIRTLAAQVHGSSWNSLDLIETLTQIAETEEQDVRLAVTELLEKAVKASAELVLMALVQIPQPWSSVHTELASKLLSMFLAGHPSHQLVFLRIWQTNTPYLLNAFRAFYVESAMNITRLLDVAQDLKILDALLQVRPFFFALDVAALASRREYLNLDKWLQDNITEHGSAFIRAALEFLDAKAKDDLAKTDPQAEQNFMPLTVQTVAVFLRILRSNGDSMTSEEIDYFKVVRNLCLQLHPRLMNLAPGAEAQEPGLQVVTFPQEIHEEADSWYRKMYEEEISIEDVVSLLQRTKASDVVRDHQIFACMVHTLFDEYRWFDLYYPPRELAMTAVVFGSLIQYQLIDYIPLGIAIRYVLDALREAPDSNMFKFGLQALLRFQERLPEWPQLGQALLALPPAQQSHPDIARMVRIATSGPLPNGGGGDKASGAASRALISTGGGAAAVDEDKPPFTAINVDTQVEDGDQTDPEEEVSDKILFLINNLSPSNIDAKLVEARRLITPQLHHWFSSYLVLQRVSIEPNNHGLYTQFIDGLDTTTLINHILHETFAKVKVLLNSDKTVQSTTERTLLKNLGSWLGGLTLARNKPIRHRNIAFKELLIQGYDSNRLIVAIPFVCKVLEQCSHSSVFVPPNPWLMAVLRLLVELYQFAELKLNLKFEIEVLCKSLSIDLKEVTPTTILRNRPQELAAAAAAAQMQQAQLQQQQQQQAAAQQQAQQQAQHQAAQQQQYSQQQHPQHMQQQQHAQLQQRQYPQQAQHQQGMHQPGQHGASGLAQDMERLSMAGQAGGYGPGSARGALLDAQQRARGVVAAPTQQQQQQQQQGGAASGAAYSDSLSLMLQNLAHYIVVNPPLFANNATLKRMVYVAIDRAIREIIAPVVERSVTIASISTRELITKDFAMEGDEGKMRKAAHQMSQNLAGSLALVTCKEPLRISMVTHARTLFLQSGFNEQTLPEQALVSIMGDNLELACSVIERAAMEKALPEVDDGLNAAYTSRRDHRSRGRGYYWDAHALTTSQYASSLPDLLRLKADGLLPQQLRIYEDFGKMPRSSSSSSPGPDGERLVGAPANPATALAEGALAEGAMPVVASMSPQQSQEKFAQCLTEIERLLQQAGPNASLVTLPPDHDLRQLVRQVPILAAASVSREETALGFSQKVVQLLYKSETSVARDLYIVLLERLCEGFLKVAKEVTAWLIYAEDERKFNVPVTSGLIRAGLINIVEQDVQLAKFIARDFRPSVVDFAARLALECLREPPCATRGQLVNTIEALTRASQRGKATESAAQFLAELEGGQLSKGQTDIGNSALREQLAYCFAEWVRLFQQSPNSEKSFIDFVTQLQTQGILKGEEISSMFFRVCTEVGVDSYIKNKAVGGNAASGIFSPIDAFSKLIVLMIKYHADPTGANNEQAKVHYLTKILSIVVLVLAQSHEELGPHFQQKPFFRLFSSLLHDLHLAESNLQLTYFQALLAISNTFNTLQPSFFPGFTFSWMSLVSHRLFMPKLLAPPESVGSTARAEGWAAFHRLFASLLRFLAPFLRAPEMRDTSRSLYHGTLRIILVLLHDFPEFLCTHHHSLCDIIPPSCIQLRNLVLAAFPARSTRLPDPFTPNLKIDKMPEVEHAPAILSDYTSILEQQNGGAFKAALDAYLHDRSSPAFLASIKDVVLPPSAIARSVDYAKGETRYDVALLNALVLYVGIASTERVGLLDGSAQYDVGIDIFQQLLGDLDPEGRYLLLTAAANQLRYPNRHTAYFSLLLLYLFGEGNEGEAATKEQITRVLLERLIVNRPHPWGLLLTTFELLRNRRYVLPKAPAEIEQILTHMKEGLTSANTNNAGGAAPGGPVFGDAGNAHQFDAQQQQQYRHQLPIEASS